MNCCLDKIFEETISTKNIEALVVKSLEEKSFGEIKEVEEEDCESLSFDSNKEYEVNIRLESFCEKNKNKTEQEEKEIKTKNFPEITELKKIGNKNKRKIDLSNKDENEGRGSNRGFKRFKSLERPKIIEQKNSIRKISDSKTPTSLKKNPFNKKNKTTKTTKGNNKPAFSLAEKQNQPVTQKNSQFKQIFKNYDDLRKKKFKQKEDEHPYNYSLQIKSSTEGSNNVVCNAGKIKNYGGIERHSTNSELKEPGKKGSSLKNDIKGRFYTSERISKMCYKEKLTHTKKEEGVIKEGKSNYNSKERDYWGKYQKH